ncbi:MAG: M23 family metallopeptidase [Spirochaetota bacterium]
MKRFTRALFFLLSMVSLRLHCEPEIRYPAKVEAGSPVRIIFYSKTPVKGLSAELTTSANYVIAGNNGFPFETNTTDNSSLWIVFIGLPSTILPGEYRLTLHAAETSGSNATYQYKLEVNPRSFTEETVYLNESMTSLRQKPDPKKIEEAKKLNEILTTFNIGAVYQTGAYILPLMNPRESAGFGDRRIYVYTNGEKERTTHTGVDLAAASGTPVAAGGAGKVVFAGNRIMTGKTVVLEHAPGIFSLYFHMEALSVKEGDEVLQGQVIGTVGTTGLATGPHLHWEIRVGGVAVEPKYFLGDALLDKDNILSSIQALTNKDEGG